MASQVTPVGSGFLLVFVIGSSAYVLPSLSDVDNRILGGYETFPNNLPYQLALEGAPDGRHVCGASVVATNWAMTAAHCVYNKPLRSLRIRAGSSIRGEGGTHHPVKFYLYHDLYRGDTLDYDVALVNVKVPFLFGPKVQAVALPRSPPRKGEAALVSGWGFLEKEQLRKPKRLVAAEVYIRSWQECKQIYPSLTPTMMCAGADDVDFCNGDSGGPLTRANREQIGVVSWLYRCGDGLPGVYTNVSAMLPWIVQSLGRYGVHVGAVEAAGALEVPQNSDYMIMFPN